MLCVVREPKLEVHLDFTVICSGLIELHAQFEVDFCRFESADGLKSKDIAVFGNNGCGFGHTANLTCGKANA